MARFGDIVHVKMSHVQGDWSVIREDRLAVVEVLYCRGCVVDPRGFEWLTFPSTAHEPLRISLSHDHDYRVLPKVMESYLLLSTKEKKAFRRIHGIQGRAKKDMAAWFQEQAALLSVFEKNQVTANPV